MVYVSSRVAVDELGEQLRSLPRCLPGLTKLELRYIVPSSVPCLGTTLQQLQPSLTALTGLGTLYLIMGASPEPAEMSAVLPSMPSLRDLKLLSGLPQFGLTNSKLEVLGCVATQLQRLHLEVSGLVPVDSGLAALSRLRALRHLWLDGLVTLGPEAVYALQQLPELQELKLELDSPQHLPDLFALPSLGRLGLVYHGDELEDAEEPQLDGPGPGAGAWPSGGSSADWEALECLLRGHAARPVLSELGLMFCSFPADPLPRLAQLTSLTSLTFEDCRWTAAAAAAAQRADAAAAAAAAQRADAAAAAAGGAQPLSYVSPLTAAAAPAALQPQTAAAARQGPWAVLAALTALQTFGMAQCVVPQISEPDLATLAAAWPGITSLQLQSTLPHPAAAPAAGFGAFLSCWSRLEALTLSGSWCNDPRVSLDVSLLPPSLTSLVISSITLVRTWAARTAVIRALGASGVQDGSRGVGLRAVPMAEGEAPASASAGGSLEPSGAAERPVGGRLIDEGEPRTACGCSDAVGSNSMAGDATWAAPGGCGHKAGQNTSAGPCGIGIGSTGAGSVINITGNGSGSSSGSGCREGEDGVRQQRCGSGHVQPYCSSPDVLLDSLEHLVLGEVRLGSGVTLQSLVLWAPNLRSLEINNLLPNLTDDTCAALAALTALTVLRVSQDQEPEGPDTHGSSSSSGSSNSSNSNNDRTNNNNSAAAAAAEQPVPEGAAVGGGGGADVPYSQRWGGGGGGVLSGKGLTALTGLRSLRQLEWLPWGCEPLGLEHVGALAALRRLHLVTLRGARDGSIDEAALRERLPLCDIDDTEWSGLVDV